MAGRWVMASIQTSFAIMPAAVYWFGGLALANGSTAIVVATLVAFTTLQTRLFFPVGSLLGVGLDVQTSLALFDRIFEYLDQPIDIEEKPDALPVGPAGDVVFDGVWFRYGDEWTLEDVSFTVPAGTTTAIVGETGSGKTTLGYLAARLYDVSRGRITIGGVDIRDLSFQALSDLVGVVSQETYLFHASVRENLRFAKPDATDEELEAAAEAARIDHVIAALPDGYDTVVGERGYRFSGGEKQRMAIARTILRNPPILVLDEATSSLDTETERLVQEALDRLSQGRTTIAIAHRLSTIRDADQIVVLDQGPHRRDRHARRARGRGRALRDARRARRRARAAHVRVTPDAESRCGRTMAAWRRWTGGRPTRASRSSPSTRRTTSSATRSSRARFRSRAGRIPTCIAGGRGRFASTRASRRPRRRTRASATCSSAGRRASRSRSTCRPSSATTRTIRAPRARWGGPASRSTRSRTWSCSSKASRSTRSRRR